LICVTKSKSIAEKKKKKKGKTQIKKKKKKKTEFEVLGHSGNRIFASSSDEGQDKDNQILCLR